MPKLVRNQQSNKAREEKQNVRTAARVHGSSAILGQGIRSPTRTVYDGGCRFLVSSPCGSSLRRVDRPWPEF
jgi:hypothetical protein